MSVTVNFQWAIPDPEGIQIIEVGRIGETIARIDAALHSYETAFSAALDSHVHPFSEITAKPSSLAGYGITDAMTSTQVTAAINAAVAGLINGAPGAIDTLKELGAALGNDANFATTMTNALAGKANLSGATFTGGVVATSFQSSGTMTVKGNALNIDGDGNRHLWFRTTAGVARGLLYHEQASGALNLRLYNASGGHVRTLSLYENGEMRWGGATRFSGVSSGDAADYWEVGGGYKFRWYFGGDGRAHLQRSTDNWNSAPTLVSFSYNLDATFGGSAYAPAHLIAGPIGGQAGLVKGEGDGANFNNANNILIDSWYGIGFLLARRGNTRLYQHPHR
ncbi:hypothetical protein BTE77_31370 [Ensifer adhaerens]|nr:hypothetical protein BTE77_31370 [Ensifer adhaerens]